MSLETATKPEDLFVGRPSNPHPYYESNNFTSITDGKSQMHDAVERLILNSECSSESKLRFMSMPGKFWRFEFRLMNQLLKRRDKLIYVTGFERDENVILGGAGYVPHCMNTSEMPKTPGFRCFNALGVRYFKTNRARWINMDVTSALTLDDSFFRYKDAKDFIGKYGCNSAMAFWLKKFCGWDAAWLDFYGPVSESIGQALSRLYIHCRRDCIPVAVTVLKGREFAGLNVSDRKAWLVDRLTSGYGTELVKVEYFEYSEGGSTMCNLLGVLLVNSKSKRRTA